MSDQVRKVNAVLARCGTDDCEVTPITIYQRDGHDVPVLAGVFPEEHRISHYRLAVYATSDPFQHGDIKYCEAMDTWEVYNYHPMRLGQDADRYVVYLNPNRVTLMPCFLFLHDLVLQ